MNEITKNNSTRIGGKAKNLHILTQHIDSVPPWMVITTDMYHRFIQHNNLQQKINTIIKKIDFNNRSSVISASKQIKKLFQDNKLPAYDKEMILDTYNKFKKKYDADYVAVRSSATGEDEAKTSFAGQLDSFLFIHKKESLISSIKQCWASGFSERALTYRHLRNINIIDIEVAVIIQQMIFGDTSGVIFTVNPLTNNHDEMLINATYGLGEGIVSGTLDTDSFTVNKQDQAISQNIVTKQHKIVFNKNKGEQTHSTPVEKTKQKQPSLTSNEVKRLLVLGKKIENLYGKAQDIEWTKKNDTIHILQARPITTLSEEKHKESSKDFKIIWDNSNIIESFPGITKPLTFSFARMAWANVFRQSALALGASPETVEKHDQLFENMIGLVHGRVYYNLMKWYQFVSFFPGFKANRRYMEQMMGVKESLQDTSQIQETQLKTRLRGIVGLIRPFFGLFKSILTIDKKMDRFFQKFMDNYEELKKHDVETLEPWELMNIFYEAKSKLLKGWRVKGVNDFLAMIFYGLVKNFTINWDLDETGSLHNNLFCGEEDMLSTKPTKELLKLTKEVKENKETKNLFVNNDAETILNELQNNERYAWFQEELEVYLDEYGSRCMNELKLEEKSLKEDPRFVLTIIKNYLKLQNLNLESINKKEAEKRKHAEKIVNQKLKGKPFKRLVFYWVLRSARKLIRNRENLRLCRTKVFGFARALFKSIGENFAEKNIINDSEDIFYLEKNEIFDFIKGTSTTLNLKNIIETRKKEYEQFEREKLPERFTTTGIVNINPISQLSTQKSEKTKKTNSVLKGVSCCPGIVENKVKVILSPDQNVELNGEILVAEKTDPGWVPLYPSVSGLLIERGSVLSHSAIVARELGLPTIVGIPDLIKRVKDGQKIKMDAGKGEVYLSQDKKKRRKKTDEEM